VEAGGNHQNRFVNKVGEWVQLLAPAKPERGPTVQKKRYIAAQAGCDGFNVDLLACEHRKSQQHSRGITGSAAKTSAHGDAFGQSKMNPGMQASRVEISAGGAQNKVIGDIDTAFNGQLGLSRWFIFDPDPIREGDGLKDGAKLMKPVGALVENAKIEIDFRE